MGTKMVKVKLLWAMLPKIKQGKTSFLGAFKLGWGLKTNCGTGRFFYFQKFGEGGGGEVDNAPPKST